MLNKANRKERRRRKQKQVQEDTYTPEKMRSLTLRQRIHQQEQGENEAPLNSGQEPSRTTTPVTASLTPEEAEREAQRRVDLAELYGKLPSGDFFDPPPMQQNARAKVEQYARQGTVGTPLHPADKALPFREHVAKNTHVYPYSDRVKGMYLGVQDLLSHRLGLHTLLLNNVLSEPQFSKSREELTSKLFSLELAMENPAAMAKLDAAIEEYMGMKHPIWEKIQEIIKPLDFFDPLNFLAPSDPLYQEFDVGVTEPLADALRDLGVSQECLGDVLPPIGTYLSYKGLDIEFYSPGEIAEERNYWIRHALFCSFIDHSRSLHPLFGLEDVESRELIPSYGELFTEEELNDLRFFEEAMVGNHELLLPYLEFLTWGSFLELAALTREYNLEWALAAVQW